MVRTIPPYPITRVHHTPPPITRVHTTARRPHSVHALADKNVKIGKNGDKRVLAITTVGVQTAPAYMLPGTVSVPGFWSITVNNPGFGQ